MNHYEYFEFDAVPDLSTRSFHSQKYSAQFNSNSCPSLIKPLICYTQSIQPRDKFSVHVFFHFNDIRLQFMRCYFPSKGWLSSDHIDRPRTTYSFIRKYSVFFSVCILNRYFMA